MISLKNFSFVSSDLNAEATKWADYKALIRIISIGSVIKDCHISSKSDLTTVLGITAFKASIFSANALLTNGLFSWRASLLNIFLSSSCFFSETKGYVTGIKLAATMRGEYKPVLLDNF